MSKRTKEELENDDLSDIDVSSTDEEEEQEEEEQEMVNVDFDFFDLNPAIDFHATKNFLRQLFGEDSAFFSISEITDLFLTEGHVGTTIKTDGKESDPFFVLSVISLTDNLSKPSIKAMIKYFLEKTNKKPQFNVVLRQLLSGTSKSRVGLIVSERLINMPVETVPPMYTMLQEEIEKADNADSEYNFDYYLIPSRVYKLVTSVIDQELEETPSAKKSKKQQPLADTIDYYHYEDEILEQNAAHHGYFDYTNQTRESDSRRVFNDYGIDPKLSLMLLDKAALKKAVLEMQAAFPAN
ncbi:hypothetical protein OGAPHI_001494 [Ogataea philodendri]|uniref:Protein BCP1 n=1 Tax=Ogataea philodendri TaxID=1378263 RepID=A0A9P8PBU3_9ASCO|nr:uncharacterized protein OGAPHI_001494 [Ogataea philodendri]KAH3669373.1 hypothetical protein OGAPHI_001494 [Ogataea philodendri]